MALLVIEVKSDVTAVEATFRKHDEKVRIANTLAPSRFGRAATSVSRLLVVPNSSTARRRIAQHAPLFRRVYPLRGAAVKAWLRAPVSAAGGLLFVSVTSDVGA